MSMKDRVYFIAEAGVNHNGSIEMALKLVDVAAESGADAVKFQTFKAESCITKAAPKAEYQNQTTDSSESQLDMVRKLELDEQSHRLLFERCKQKGIQFLSTPFDFDSVDLLVNSFDLPILKIPSGEITNAPLLLKIARTGKPVILSTGMSTLGDIEQALGVLAFGYTSKNSIPSYSNFNAAYSSEAGRAALQRKVKLLHCTTEYPAPASDVNLRAMDTMAMAFGLPVGFSDHTEGIAIAIAAVARGAVIVEKHFTLDRTLPGPDHRASLEPSELMLLIKSIRTIESALGIGCKHPTKSEINNLTIARKSLIAAVDIAEGTVFSEHNIGVKRPGTGVTPMLFWDFVGKKAQKKYSKDDLL